MKLFVVPQWIQPLPMNRIISCDGNAVAYHGLQAMTWKWQRVFSLHLFLDQPCY